VIGNSKIAAKITKQ